jgi:hypothetical protein
LASLKTASQVVTDENAALHVQCDEFRTSMRVVQSSVSTLADTTEHAERAKRSCNILLTGLPEAEGETVAGLEGVVQELLGALHVEGVQVREVRRLGPSRRTYAEAASGVEAPRPRVRPVVLRLATTTDKIALLKGRVHLRDSERFKRLGVNTDLTRMQQANKAAAWPAFLAARKGGKKCWWVDDTLMIEGKAHKC